ncbi:MAG: hypothetical protein ACE3L7_23735 [Candidatus Pristimantibacillus sp.]
MTKKSMLLIVASILFMSLILVYFSQVYSNGKFEKYVVKDMDESPNMIILVENQSSKKEKITFIISIDDEKFSKKTLITQAAENFYLKLPEENYKIQVETEDEIVKQDFEVTADKQVFIVFTYNKDSTLTIHTQQISLK